MSYYTAQEAQGGMAILAGWLGKNHKIKVVYHNGTDVCADIYTGVIKIPKLACASGVTQEAIQLLRTMVYHESGHIAETHIEKSEYPAGALHSIWNALEDRRMEGVLSEQHLGCREVFQWAMGYCNKRIAGQIASGAAQAPLWEALCAMGIMLEGLQPAWHLTPKAAAYVKAAYDEFSKIRKARDAKGSLEIAKRIYKLLEDACKKFNEENKPKEKKQEKKQEKSDKCEKGKKQDKSDKSEKQDKCEKGEGSSQADDMPDEDAEKDEGEGEGSDDKDDKKDSKKSEKQDKKSGKSKKDDEESDDSDEDDSDKDSDDDAGDDKDESEDSDKDDADDKDDKKSKGKKSDKDEESDDSDSDAKDSDTDTSDEDDDNSEHSDKDADDSEEGDSDEDSEDSDSKDSGKDSKDQTGDLEDETGKPQDDGSESKGEKGDGKDGEDSESKGLDADEDADDSDDDNEGENSVEPAETDKPYQPQDIEDGDSELAKKQKDSELEQECDGADQREILNERLDELFSKLTPSDREYLAFRDADIHNVPDEQQDDRQNFVDRRGMVATAVSAMTRALEQALRSMAKVKKDPYLRQGKIDKKRFVQIAKSLSREVFYKTRPGEDLNVAVELIIDESGSMGNWLDVQLVAVAIGEALSQINVPFEIFGTTTKFAGGDNNMPKLDVFSRTNPIVFQHYKNFDENWLAVRHRIVHTGKHHHNIDGEAVEFAAYRLAQRKEERKIIFSLSDGEPCGGHSNDSEMCENLKRVCDRVRKSGIEVYGFGIGTEAPEAFYGKKWFVYLEKLDQMGQDFIRKLSEVITCGRVKV